MLILAHRLQTVWLTIFSHGSSYLFSLGISELHTSLIWTAAPVCGSIVSPVIGAISDRSRIPWGRRRPFIVMGAVIIIVAFSALAWIEPITRLLCSLHSEPSMAATVMQYWAVFWVVILNVGIQCLQSGSRSLIVDVCPSAQQSLASAWAGRFTGFGNILGYILGSIPLPFLASDHEAWRFRCMALFAVTLLSISVAVTVHFIQEESPEEALYEQDDASLLVRTFRGVVQGLATMPPKARRVCKVQFFSAMGWFGFLFYSTSYVSELYLGEIGTAGVKHSSAHKDSGMRLATTSSLLFALVALGMNVVLPHIKSCFEDRAPSGKDNVWSRVEYFCQIHILWALGHLLYAFLALSTFAISSSTGGTVAVTLAGLSWGVTQWAPFALLGEEIASQQAERESLAELGGKRWATNQSGAMLGVHSAAVSIPQIMAAMACSCIFWLTSQLGMGDAVAWVLRWSGIAGAIAAWFAYQL